MRSSRQAPTRCWTACAIAIAVAMTMACSSKPSNPSLTARSPSPPAATPAVSQAPAAVPPAVQAVADRLLARDIEGVMRLVELVPRGCATQSSGPGTPPTCAPGQAAGSPIPAFVVSECEGSYLTTTESVRAQVEGFLSLAPQLSLHSIIRDPERRSGAEYIVATIPGPIASSTLRGHLWAVTEDGKIVTLHSSGCTFSIAMDIAFTAPNGQTLVGPKVTCSPNPGNRVDVSLTVRGVLYPSPGERDFGMVQGPTISGGSQPTGEVQLLRVPSAAQWTGSIKSFDDVRGGTKVRATGLVTQDCSVQVATIDAEP